LVRRGGEKTKKSMGKKEKNTKPGETRNGAINRADPPVSNSKKMKWPPEKLGRAGSIGALLSRGWGRPMEETIEAGRSRTEQ